MKLIHVFSIFGTAESFFDGQFGYLVDQGYEIIVVSSDSSDTNNFCLKNKVRFVPVNIPRSVSPMALVKAVRSLCLLFKKEKPNAVFGHTPVGALCAMIAAKLCGVDNRIYYRHGLIYTTMTGLKKIVFKTEEKFVSGLACKIINVSHSLSRLSVKEGLNSAAKQYVIGEGTCGGIDALSIFNPSLIDACKLETLKKKMGLDCADVVFGFCGRICNDKGVPELIDAFLNFQKQNPKLKAKLLLIGRYDIRDSISLEKQHQIECNNDIIISGHIVRKDIPYYYSMLDVFVFPSHREGFGMCVIEASAMEKPILDSKAHGCVDAIVEHETGEYIELSANGILKGMELMLNKSLREELGKKGRSMVLMRYDIRVMWPLVRKLYSEIVNSSTEK